MSNAEEQVVLTQCYHSFFSMFHHAFNNHLGVSLRADDLLLVITQGLADCINKEPEIYRNKFVQHEEKLLITIRNDSFIKGKKNDWINHFSK